MSTPETLKVTSPSPAFERGAQRVCEACGALTLPATASVEVLEPIASRERSPPRISSRAGRLLMRLCESTLSRGRRGPERGEVLVSISSSPEFEITEELRDQMTPEDAELVTAYFTTLRDSDGTAYEYGT